MKKCVVFFTKLMVCSFAPEDGIFTRDGLADSQPPLLDNTSLASIKTATFGKPRKICHQLDNRIRNRRIGSKGNSQIVGPRARTRLERRSSAVETTLQGTSPLHLIQ
ncbi:uncharacterized protein LOC119765335 [Culex quinquefasciatus]|uniref:uncharacterized protein LOC119765335 n=1 Tax=Culex quinquefasciatus TaxID=7176 RepID=UPI0018E3E3B0|nr:uncharacterized protein LOC119765335 [Culex quinquefasciatus]